MSTGLTTSERNNLFTLAPKSMSEAMEYAKLISQSSMVPVNFQGKPADVLVAVQMGAELGLPPTQALQNIAVINGRPSVWGDALLAIARASHVCEYIKETFNKETNTARCEAKRRNEDPVIHEFSMEEANHAGLTEKKGPWTQYPKRMLQMRARAFALRDAFPDVLRGICVREEAEDTPSKHSTYPSNTKTRTEKLLYKIKGVEESEELPSKQVVIEKITRATSKEELNQAASIAIHLPETEKEEARKHYEQKLQDLNGKERNA